MKTKRYFRVVIRGELLGHIWQDNGKARKEIEEYKRPEENLFSFVKRICKDGDFQDAKLSKDSLIEVRMQVGGKDLPTFHHMRIQWWDIDSVMFPSIQEFVEEE